jgi:hypothetical protein
MANALLTINMITREAVRLWKNTNAFIQNVDMQYDPSFAVSGAKIGAQLRIRLPNDFVVTTGPGLSVQDTAEQSTTLVMSTQQHVDVSFSMVDRTLSLDDYSRRILAPMINVLAGAVATNIIGSSEGGICNFIANQDSGGNINTPIMSTYLGAGAVLDNNSAPIGNRKIVNSPDTQARVVSGLAGLLNPRREISEQYVSGEMYDALGFVWMKDQTVIKHTTGTLAQGSATVNGAGQTGNSVTVNALAGSLNQGDIITIAGVFAVNRITKQSTGKLRTFAVTANVPTGATSIPVYPAIVPAVNGQSVQYQTVTASPANGAAVNQAALVGPSTTYNKNFAFSPEAVTMATADLEIPNGVHESAREEFDGVSMRMLSDYFIGTDQLITRLDVLYGWLWIRPEWAVVIADQI